MGKIYLLLFLAGLKGTARTSAELLRKKANETENVIAFP